MLIRSINLSTETTEAWKSAGCWFPRRDRSDEEALNLWMANGKGHILNLGDSSFEISPELANIFSVRDELVWNVGRDIKPLVKPGPARSLLNNLMPEYPTEYPADVWIKAPGSGGRGKNRTTLEEERKIPEGWDLQVHVEGEEYRVVTVRDKVVQVSQREGANGARNYTWVGVENSPRPVKQIAKNAARLLKGQNIIGWDVVYDKIAERAYILEGNSCPGVNQATAARIVKAMFEPGEPDA